MKRRNFLVAPLLATVGAGASAASLATRDPLAAQTHSPLALTLLRLDDGSAHLADLPGHDAAWRLPVRSESLDRARVTLRGLVTGSHAPHGVHVQALFGSDNEARPRAHDVLRYFSAAHLENGKPVGFDASREAFCGFRIAVSLGGRAPAQIAQTGAIDLEPGTYALVFGTRRDALAMIASYANASSTRQPNYLVFGIAVA